MKNSCLVTFNSGTNGSSQIRFNFLWRFTLALMSRRNFNTLKEFLSKAVIKHALDSAKQLSFRGPFSPSDIVWWGIVSIFTWVVSARFVRASFDIWKIARCAHYTDVEKAVDGDCSSFYHSCKPLKQSVAFCPTWFEIWSKKCVMTKASYLPLRPDWLLLFSIIWGGSDVGCKSIVKLSVVST